MKKLCITFAGAVGSSKTPISNYISTKTNLPIFNNDAIRSEVIEDLGYLDNEEQLKRRKNRLNDILKSGVSFITDASIDRNWEKFKEQLKNNNYQRFIISMNLSKKLLTKLYKAKKYTESLAYIDKLLEDHKKFLEKYSKDVGINIDDKKFPNRLEEVFQAVKSWLKNQ